MFDMTKTPILEAFRSKREERFLMFVIYLHRLA